MDAELEEKLASVMEQERSMGASDEASQLGAVLNEEPAGGPPETDLEADSPPDPDLSAQASTEPALIEPESAEGTGAAETGEDQRADQPEDQAPDQAPDDRVSAIISEERGMGNAAEADELQQALHKRA